MAERRGQVAVKDLPPKLQKKLRRQKIMPKKARKLNRSMAGNALLFTLMFICGVFMALPLVMIINNALKPLDELYQFPPKIFVRNPNLRNFSDLFILMNDSWVPFSRYIMNTIIITVAGMVGHVIVASWAAYPLAKDKFPGKALLFGMVVLSMMFNWTVTQIPQYAIISWLHINNTYLALILPAWSFGMGLYLMKQFMEQLPDSLMESARVQGANEWQIFWKIVMPNVKPAWLTLAIFQFQQMWGNTGSLFLRDEQLKPMQYALQQITAGGVSRAGDYGTVSRSIEDYLEYETLEKYGLVSIDVDYSGSITVDMSIELAMGAGKFMKEPEKSSLRNFQVAQAVIAACVNLYGFASYWHYSALIDANYKKIIHLKVLSSSAQIRNGIPHVNPLRKRHALHRTFGKTPIYGLCDEKNVE